MTTFHRATAIVAAVLLSSSLTACSLIGGSRNNSSDRESASAQSTDSQGAGSQATGPTDESSQQASDGHQTVTTSTTMISFDIPENWAVMTCADMQDDQKIALFARAFNMDPDQAREVVSQIDMQALSPTPDANGFIENANVAPMTGIRSLPTEDAMYQQIQAQGGEPTGYSTSQTMLGEAAVLTYTMTQPQSAQILQGIQIAAPSKSESGDWATITVTTTDAARTQELADTVLSTLS